MNYIKDLEQKGIDLNCFTSLLNDIAVKLSNDDLALPAFELLEKAILISQDSNGEPYIYILMNQALMYYENKSYDNAQLILQYIEKRNDKSIQTLIEICYFLGVIFYTRANDDFSLNDDYAKKSLEYFYKALEKLTELAKDNEIYSANSRNSIDSKTISNESGVLRKSPFWGSSSHELRYAHFAELNFQIGLSYRLIPEYGKAVKNFEEALQYAIKDDTTSLIINKIFKNIIDCYDELSDSRKVNTYFKQWLDYNKHFNPYKPQWSRVSLVWLMERHPLEDIIKHHLNDILRVKNNDLLNSEEIVENSCALYEALYLNISD
jgi:hypothetical protein